MKYFNDIKKLALGLFLTLAVAVGCQEEVDPAANAVQTEMPTVTFAATDAPEQIVPVYADGEWHADCEADWVTISPMSGNGSVDVTISVADNLTDEGVVNSPREVIVIFRGKYAERQGELTVYQNGDAYLGVPERTLSEVAALESGSVAKIKGAQVVAVALDGFLLSDGAAFMFAQKKEAEVAVGDKLFLNGKTSTLNGYPSFVVDEYSVLESSEVKYPEAIDLTSSVDSYNAETIQYVKIDGTIVGNSVKNIPGTPSKPVNFYPAAAAVDIDAVSVHKVTLYAYHIGISGGAHQLVVVSYKDNGVDDTIGVEFPFKDDFMWLDSYIAAANEKLPEKNKIDDVVAKQSSSSDGAANLYTTLADNGCDVLGELRARGYVDLNPGQKTIYMQDGYLKFGKTDCQSGLTLPLMKIDGEQDIAVQFQWCSHITGSGNVDKTELVVAIEGPGTVVTNAGTTNAKVSDPVPSKQEKNQMFWQDVTIKINGATAGTFITIRPKDEQMGTVDEPKTGQFRYHLDNIKVILASELVPAHMEVTGVENDLITFEGIPQGPASFEVTSDKEFTVESNVPWLSFSQTSGPAFMPTVIEVICAESELSELRKGEISVKSGTSVHKIQVVQSAAGTELAPFISLVGGNSNNVGFDAGTITLGIQANVEYEFQSDASWITVEPAPETKAKVETTELLVNYDANAADQPRTAHIRVFNSSENLEAIYTLTQAAYESGVYFQDNFDWVSNMAAAAGAGDSMSNDKADTAPNAYTALDGFADALAAQGYEDLLPGTNTIYLQTNYLKFSRESRTNGIKLPAISYGETTDAVLTFDWGVHVGGGGPDAVELVVELEGNGSVNAVPIPHTAGNWEWQTQKYYLSGVDDNTRIIIKPSTYTGEVDATKTYYRWYIDNIKVAKPKVETVAEWLFTADAMASYADNFGTTAGLVDLNPGDGGQFVDANVTGSGKITYVQVDKNGLELEKAEEQPWRITGGSGHPYVRGIWLGDYWLFEGDSNTTYPAGTIFSINYITRTSKTGFKYWRVEYLDGETWKPAMPVTATTVNDLAIEYNLVMANDGSTNVEVSPIVSLTSATKGLKFRMVALANVRSSNEAVIAKINGGTSRIAGAEGTSPVIKVIK